MKLKMIYFIIRIWQLTFGCYFALVLSTPNREPSGDGSEALFSCLSKFCVIGTKRGRSTRLSK